jgi:hypothetical protein
MRYEWKRIHGDQDRTRIGRRDPRWCVVHRWGIPETPDGTAGATVKEGNAQDLSDPTADLINFSMELPSLIAQPDP